MTIEKILEQFDLTNKKASAYLACLELGPSTVQAIARKARIKRTTTYDILEDLVEKGLVTYTIRGKKKYFLAEDPETLKSILKEKERMLDEILPQLKSIYNLPGIKPKIRYYKGVEEIKTIFRETLKCKSKETLGLLPPIDLYEFIGVDYMKNYVKSRVKLKIKNKTIRVKAWEAEEKYFLRHKEQLREMRYAPKGIVFHSTIIIFDDKVAVISSRKESFGFLIESVEFSQTMKVLFGVLWKQSKKVSSK